MLLKNKTTGKLISKNLKIAKTLSDNIFGLLREKPETTMMFNTRFGIHTFFMKYPITVLVLDEKNRIVKIKKYLRPNNLFFWNPKFSKLIELPATQETFHLGEILLFDS